MEGRIGTLPSPLLLAASGRWAAFADCLLLARCSLAEAQTRSGPHSKTGHGAT